MHTRKLLAIMLAMTIVAYFVAFCNNGSNKHEKRHREYAKKLRSIYLCLRFSGAERGRLPYINGECHDENTEEFRGQNWRATLSYIEQYGGIRGESNIQEICRYMKTYYSADFCPALFRCSNSDLSRTKIYAITNKTGDEWLVGNSFPIVMSDYAADDCGILAGALCIAVDEKHSVDWNTTPGLSCDAALRLLEDGGAILYYDGRVVVK